jgi:hypothetical protein
MPPIALYQCRCAVIRRIAIIVPNMFGFARTVKCRGSIKKRQAFVAVLNKIRATTVQSGNIVQGPSICSAPIGANGLKMLS